MRKMKIAVLLAAGVLALTACGQGTRKEETKAATEAAATAEAETDAVSEADDDYAGAGYETISPEEDAALTEEVSRMLAESLQESVDEAAAEDLSILIAYPCYVGVGDGVVVNNEDEFLAIDMDEYMTDEMKEAIKSADIENIEMTEAGLIVGAESGTPNVIFGIAEDGTVGITGINP